MSETYELKAEVRDGVGKGASRAVRRQGKIPAVIYGDKQPAIPIALPLKETTLRVQAGGFLTHVVTVDVGGERIRVIPKDYQLDPVRDFLLHVDFLRVAEGTRLTLDIPVHFINEHASPGLKRGGALNIVRHAIELYVPVDAIPEFIEVDLTGLEIGDSLHISAVTLPGGVTPTITDRDFTIATIAGSGGAADAEADAAAAAEGGAG
jgi:large subunit ribosomal protein L25